MKNLKEKLIKIEDELDKLNGDYGDKNSYCIFCKSQEYNGIEGVIHTTPCVMSQIRKLIKKQ